MQAAQINPAQTIMEINDFFEKVDKANGGDGIVWAKATAPKGNQVIIHAENSQGKRVPIPPIKAGEPVCISRFCPRLEVLRDLSDLAECARAGLLKLMTSQEAKAFFDKRAGLLKTSPQELMAKSHQEAAKVINAKPLSDAEVDTSQRLQEVPALSIEDAINPRVQHLCNQVSVRLDDDQKLPVKELMAELLNLEDSLSLEDLEYIRASGYYPSVKRWAEQKQREVAESQGLIPQEDELSV